MHRSSAEVVKVIGRAARLRPVGLAVVVVIADCRLVVNSMIGKNVDCSLGVLPLRLPT